MHLVVIRFVVTLAAAFVTLSPGLGTGLVRTQLQLVITIARRGLSLEGSSTSSCTATANSHSARLAARRGTGRTNGHTARGAASGHSGRATVARSRGRRGHLGAVSRTLALALCWTLLRLYLILRTGARAATVLGTRSSACAGRSARLLLLSLRLCHNGTESLHARSGARCSRSAWLRGGSEPEATSGLRAERLLRAVFVLVQPLLVLLLPAKRQPERRERHAGQRTGPTC